MRGLTSTTTSAAALGVGEVNANPPTVELLLVEVVDGGVRLLGGTEGDEAEAARATSLTIPHDDGLNDTDTTVSVTTAHDRRRRSHAMQSFS